MSRPTDWPEPEVPVRPAEANEIPRGAGVILRLAEAAGWIVKPTYARGTRPGRPPRVVDSLALRMRKHSRRAAAVWTDGRFDMAIVWGVGRFPTSCTATELREELTRR